MTPYMMNTHFGGNNSSHFNSPIPHLPVEKSTSAGGAPMNFQSTQSKEQRSSADKKRDSLDN